MLTPWSFDLVHKVSKMTKKLKINACLGVVRATFVLCYKIKHLALCIGSSGRVVQCWVKLYFFCKFDPSYWFFGQVRSNDAWKVGFLSKNFSEFDAYYINLVYNTNVAQCHPKHALIFNFLVILETLWTKSKDQGVSIWNFLTFGTSLHKMKHPTEFLMPIKW